jgi:hypothetical protein
MPLGPIWLSARPARSRPSSPPLRLDYWMQIKIIPLEPHPNDPNVDRPMS